jgi:hypothetical protein
MYVYNRRTGDLAKTSVEDRLIAFASRKQLELAQKKEMRDLAEVHYNYTYT